MVWPDMIRRIIGFLLRKALASNLLKGRLYGLWYRYIDRRIGKDGVAFMNYGFAPIDGDEPDLQPQDETDRYNLQLYHAVAGAVPLTGLDVLEMSCGRGGGASYVARYLRPQRMVGVDRTESAVVSCRRNYESDGLGFVCGDALGFPFADESFDAVINVEASHCYPDLGRFLTEVRRVLRVGGHLLYADFRKAGELIEWKSAIRESGLEAVEECDITPNVVRALELNECRLQGIIDDVAPQRQRALFRQFAGTKGTVINESFRTGKAKYIRFVLKKVGV